LINLYGSYSPPLAAGSFIPSEHIETKGKLTGIIHRIVMLLLEIAV
jgi:hypothetical protein